MLDDIRTTLIKRAFLDIKYLTPDEVDALLEQHYGKDFRVQYGIETQEEADKRKARNMTPYLGKSQHQIEEERLKKARKAKKAKAEKKK